MTEPLHPYRQTVGQRKPVGPVTGDTTHQEARGHHDDRIGGQEIRDVVGEMAADGTLVGIAGILPIMSAVRARRMPGRQQAGHGQRQGAGTRHQPGNGNGLAGR